MPKKKAASKKKEEKSVKPARPTRCPPDFEWQPRPRLVEATDRNDVDRVKRLLHRGEDPTTALHHAIGRGKLSVAIALLEAGADPQAEAQPGDYWDPPPPPPPKTEVGCCKAKGVVMDLGGWEGGGGEGAEGGVDVTLMGDRWEIGGRKRCVEVVQTCAKTVSRM